ncbi:MAG: siderophore-interacting protein [Verrucomicrobia bacterium]|nr:siderophore-interacting protein [Verrucomicrobiota bacterium]
MKCDHPWRETEPPARPYSARRLQTGDHALTVGFVQHPDTESARCG